MRFFLLFLLFFPAFSFCKHRKWTVKTTTDTVAGDYALKWIPQNPSTSNFRFELGIAGDTVGDTAYDTPIYDYSVGSIKIFHKKTGKVYQVIAVNDAQPTPKPSDALIIEDCNFDGHPDLMLMQFLTAGPNVPYFYWIYNPETTLFESASDWENITSPKFDRRRKCIVSEWRNGVANYGKDTYRLINKKPVLTEREEIKSDLVGNDYKIIYTKSKRMKGKMKVIKREFRKDYDL